MVQFWATRTGVLGKTQEIVCESTVLLQEQSVHDTGLSIS